MRTKNKYNFLIITRSESNQNEKQLNEMFDGKKFRFFFLFGHSPASVRLHFVVVNFVKVRFILSSRKQSKIHFAVWINIKMFAVSKPEAIESERLNFFRTRQSFRKVKICRK